MTEQAVTNENNGAAAALHKATVDYAYLRLKDHLNVSYEFTEHGAHYTDDPETLARLISETHRIADEMVSDTVTMADGVKGTPDRAKDAAN